MAILWNRLYAERAAHMRASDIREAFVLSEDPHIISFAGGFPGPESFPLDNVQQILAELDGETGRRALQYAPSEGMTELRELIASRMSEQGMPATSEEILITNGSQQALDLFAKVFLDPGDRVATESPGYAGAFNVFHCYQAELVQTKLDDEGLIVSELASRLEEMSEVGEPLPKMLYLVPNFHNPVGVTLSLPRRRELLGLARQFGFVILEDNPYGELRYEGEALPSIRSLDKGDHTVYLGSFSKVFLPGLRVGWVKGPASVIRRLAVAKQAADLCGSTLSQWLLLRALQTGVVDKGLRGLQQFYKKRRDAMLEALKKYMPQGCSWTEPTGGFFVWLTIPAGLDAKVLLPRAIEEAGIAYVAGSGFFEGPEAARTVRLAFSQQSPERIEEGIQRFAQLLEREMETGRKRGIRDEVSVHHA